MSSEDAEWRWSVIRHWVPEGGTGAELGVFKGDFSALLLRKSPKRLYLVDPWYRAAPIWSWVRNEDRSTVAALRNILERFQAEIEAGQVVPIVDYSVPFLQSLPPHSLDFCYLDSSHSYEGTVAELAAIERVLRPRGVLLGDDWREDEHHRHHGVCRAVREWLDSGRAVQLFAPENRQWGLSYKA
jgi:SAM-dependent methyltransferase